MNYKQDEFFELIERVEEDGGELLEDLCTGRRYAFAGDRKLPAKAHHLDGCNSQALFRVPYEATSVKGRVLGERSLVVCAVDDSVGAWPRFGGDLGDEEL